MTACESCEQKKENTEISEEWSAHNSETVMDCTGQTDKAVFDTAVSAGTQTGICYGIAPHCSVMVM